MKTLFKECKKKQKAALILGLICLIFAIINLFLRNDNLQKMIWVVLQGVFLLDLLFLLEDNIRLQKEKYDLNMLSINEARYIINFADHFENSDKETFTKDEILSELTDLCGNLNTLYLESLNKKNTGDTNGKVRK